MGRDDLKRILAHPPLGRSGGHRDGRMPRQGWAEALALRGEGAFIVASDIALGDEADALSAALGDDGLVVRHDVASPGDWDRVVAAAMKPAGRIDILVNNAGIHWKRSIADESLDDVRRMLDVNLLGAFNGIRAVAPAMRAAGRGSIVNISSIAAVLTFPDRSAYAMAKWGLRGLTRSAAYELGPCGVRVNCLLPGAVKSSMLQTRGASGAGAGRVAPASEIASALLFLCSDDSQGITGVDLISDGGYVAGAGRSLLPERPGLDL